jgi:hypothetical protein
MKSFKYYFGDEFLNIVKSPVQIDDESNWLAMIVRKHRKTFHPIRHLLMVEYLGLNLRELFELKQEVKPFGKGPWPCLNAGAEHYMKSIVDDLKITYDSKSKKIIGTFTCSCGYVYSRSGPDVDENDRYKIGRIKNFGEVWENKLKELINKKLGLRAIARELRVDPKTVEKYANKLGLELCWKSKETNEFLEVTIISSNNNFDTKKDYQNKWLSLIKELPGKSKTELRKMDNGLYTWLYRNNKEWLNSNSPKATNNISINRRINWNDRDGEILMEVKAVVESMLNSCEKPERITVSKIGKKIGRLSLLEKHLDRLPLTKSYVDKSVESIDEFRKRRILWAIKTLKREGEEVRAWKVIKKAGIREDGTLEEYINNIVNNYDIWN